MIVEKIKSFLKSASIMEKDFICYIVHLAGTPSGVFPNAFPAMLQGVKNNPKVKFKFITDVGRVSRLDECGEPVYYEEYVIDNLEIVNMTSQEFWEDDGAKKSMPGKVQDHFSEEIEACDAYCAAIPEVLYGDLTTYLNNSEKKFHGLANKSLMPPGLEHSNWDDAWETLEDDSAYYSKGKLFIGDIEVPWANCHGLKNVPSNFTWQDDVEAFRVTNRGYLSTPT
jgi:hypothetical protein